MNKHSKKNCLGKIKKKKKLWWWGFCLSVWWVALLSVSLSHGGDLSCLSWAVKSCLRALGTQRQPEAKATSPRGSHQVESPSLEQPLIQWESDRSIKRQSLAAKLVPSFFLYPFDSASFFSSTSPPFVYFSPSFSLWLSASLWAKVTTHMSPACQSSSDLANKHSINGAPRRVTHASQNLLRSKRVPLSFTWVAWPCGGQPGMAGLRGRWSTPNAHKTHTPRLAEVGDSSVNFRWGFLSNPAITQQNAQQN